MVFEPRLTKMTMRQNHINYDDNEFIEDTFSNQRRQFITRFDNFFLIENDDDLQHEMTTTDELVNVFTQEATMT